MTAHDLFLAEAQTLLGARGLTRDADLMEPWLTDWRGRFTGRALAMASPASTPEVAAMVKLCARHGVAVVPQGGNSGLVGGGVPRVGATRAQVILSTRRLDRLAGVDPATAQLAAGAGVTLADAQRAARAADLDLALDLAARDQGDAVAAARLALPVPRVIGGDRPLDASVGHEPHERDADVDAERLTLILGHSLQLLGKLASGSR